VRVTVAGHRALVSDNGKHVTVKLACPKCGTSPVRAVGQGIVETTHDTYVARAISLCCREPLGDMRTTVDTIFGIEEDEAVLNGRPRVYGGGRR
jgi:hypothetical protein